MKETTTVTSWISFCDTTVPRDNSDVCAWALQWTMRVVSSCPQMLFFFITFAEMMDASFFLSLSHILKIE